MVDEAQDLSPMQLGQYEQVSDRLNTVVGDVAVHRPGYATPGTRFSRSSRRMTWRSWNIWTSSIAFNTYRLAVKSLSSIAP